MKKLTLLGVLLSLFSSSLLAQNISLNEFLKRAKKNEAKLTYLQAGMQKQNSYKTLITFDFGNDYAECLVNAIQIVTVMKVYPDGRYITNDFSADYEIIEGPEICQQIRAEQEATLTLNEALRVDIDDFSDFSQVSVTQKPAGLYQLKGKQLYDDGSGQEQELAFVLNININQSAFYFPSFYQLDDIIELRTLKKANANYRQIDLSNISLCEETEHDYGCSSPQDYTDLIFN